MHSYVQGHPVPSMSMAEVQYSRSILITEIRKHFFPLETVFPDPAEEGFLGFMVPKSYFLPSSSWPCMAVTAMPWLPVSHRPLCWCWMRPLWLLIPSQLCKLLPHSPAGSGVCCLPCTLKCLSSPTALYNFIINMKLNWFENNYSKSGSERCVLDMIPLPLKLSISEGSRKQLYS